LGRLTAATRSAWHPWAFLKGHREGIRDTSVFNVLGAVGALLANPIVAGLLGLGLGIGLLLFSRASARMMTPDEPEIGFARVAVALVLRMAFAVVTLLGFYLWIRPGLVPFGVGLVAGFFVMIVVELFSLGGRSAPSVR
jgi:membrane-associated phospholipid phosphatase